MAEKPPVSPFDALFKEITASVATAELRSMAAQTYAIFDAYVKSGFTRAEALVLVTTMITNSMQGGK
jgi:hypothetical protein